MMTVVNTYGIISSAILTAYFPMLVPPNFWTSHFTSGSILFWCRFGGVFGDDIGLEAEVFEGLVKEGVESSDSDIVFFKVF